ncbi:hypothetical protein SAY86_006372 [Trapa natans]|uniref:PsbP C-terminal domain-containing protein n=1 Tax=Trapa natans TaxID=22666 RepID=A0AAN7L773_TRANT|nr:hypothetical protein SAY86_006372 [Trapa natans]
MSSSRYGSRRQEERSGGKNMCLISKEEEEDAQASAAQALRMGNLNHPGKHRCCAWNGKSWSVLLNASSCALGCCSSLYRKEETGAGRRELLLQMSLSAASLQAISASSHASADEGPAEDFKFYVDNENKFKISIPLDWQVGSGEPSNSFKSVTAFYPKENLSSNVSIVITGIGPDFTTMGSFGKVDAFAENLVNGLDRSWQRPPGVVAKLINCKDANGFYYIEYLLQNPGEKRRHIYSAIGMAFNGWYNRLYTVTGQFLEEESDKVSSKIEKAVASFRFI